MGLLRGKERGTASGLNWDDIKPRTDVAVFGDRIYRIPGTFSWTCPAGVTSVSVVCIGAGATGYTNGGPGGSGGGLGWKNNIPVTPGQNYTVVVGGVGTTGGTSYFINTSTVSGVGGTRPSRNGNNTIFSPGAVGGGYTGDGGGQGGSSGGGYYTYGAGGGGGAGGYLGKGGTGGNGGQSNISIPPTDAIRSIHGGAGGGASGIPGGGSKGSGAGGGTGLYGITGPSVQIPLIERTGTGTVTTYERQFNAAYYYINSTDFDLENPSGWSPTGVGGAFRYFEVRNTTNFSLLYTGTGYFGLSGLGPGLLLVTGTNPPFGDNVFQSGATLQWRIFTTSTGTTTLEAESGGNYSQNPFPPSYESVLGTTYQYDAVAPTWWGLGYGGGYGCTGGNGGTAGVGQPGAVRIVWGENVSYPYNAVQKSGRLLTNMVTGDKYGYPDGATPGYDPAPSAGIPAAATYYADMTNYYQWHAMPTAALGPYRYIPIQNPLGRMQVGTNRTNTTNTWTYEAWIWWDGTSPGLQKFLLSFNGGSYQATSNRSSPGGFAIRQANNSGQLTFVYSSFSSGIDEQSENGSSFGTNANCLMIANQWNHIAIEVSNITSTAITHRRAVNGNQQYGASTAGFGAAATDGGLEIQSVTIGDLPTNLSRAFLPTSATGGANDSIRIAGVCITPTAKYQMTVNTTSFTPQWVTNWVPGPNDTVLRVV